MRLFTSLIATAAIVLSAGSAFAAATWSASATTSLGSPLSALLPGETVTLSIGLTTTAPEALGISGSVNNYDSSVVAPAAGGHVLAPNALNQVCLAAVGCFGGLANLEPALRVETGVEGAGNEATFYSALSVTAATGTGALDDPFPQFQVVFEAVGAGSTVLRIGTYGDYADAYTSATGDNVSNNVEIPVTVVPEPGTALLMGLGLAGLAAAGRRE